MKKVGVYLENTKPRVWGLGALIGASGAIIAGGELKETILSALAVALAVAGAESLGNLVDMHIDSVMPRTMRRPLPSGRMKPSEAIVLGTVLTTPGLLISYYLSILSCIIAVLGIFDYVVLYCMLSKRKTSFNILIGSFAGAALPLVGYTSVRGLDAKAILLGITVVLWIPIHIWSLAVKFKDDYAKAGVPMLPVVIGERWTIQILIPLSILLAVSVVTLKLGLFYIISTSLLSVGLVASCVFSAIKPSAIWTTFKFTSIYLALVYIFAVADTLA